MVCVKWPWVPLSISSLVFSCIKLLTAFNRQQKTICSPFESTDGRKKCTSVIKKYKCGGAIYNPQHGQVIYREAAGDGWFPAITALYRRGSARERSAIHGHGKTHYPLKREGLLAWRIYGAHDGVSNDEISVTLLAGLFRASCTVTDARAECGRQVKGGFVYTQVNRVYSTLQ